MPTDEGYEVIAARLEGAINTAVERLSGQITNLHTNLDSVKSTADRAHTRLDQLDGRLRQNFMLALSGILFPLLVGGAFLILNRGG